MLVEILLGVIQGIAEWLPISSSGHLALFQQYFHTGTPVIYDIMLHVATLIVIFIVFWDEILKMIKAVLRFDFSSDHGRLALFIIIGSIPTAIIGLLFQNMFLGLFTNVTAIGVALVINGIILSLTKHSRGSRKLTWVDSLIVGAAQGVAIIPGLSRSGLTISAGLFRGVERRTIAAFSFLLAVPAIIGAALLESRDLVVGSLNYSALAVSMLVSMVVGYFALKFLLKLVLNKKLYVFAYYCWIAGLLIIITQSI